MAKEILETAKEFPAARRPFLSLDGWGAGFISAIVIVLAVLALRPALWSSEDTGSAPVVLFPSYSVTGLVVLSVLCAGFVIYNAVMRARLINDTVRKYDRARKLAAQFEDQRP